MRQAGIGNGLGHGTPGRRSAATDLSRSRVVPFSALYWFRLFWFFITIGFLTFCAVAGPAQNPKRTVNNFAVDLTPLFKWWTNQTGPRPLAGWVHLTGSIVGTNSGGWIVELNSEQPARQRKSKESNAGTGTEGENQKVLLRNPPLDDLAEFHQLSSRLAQLNAQRGTLIDQEIQAKERDQAVTEQQRTARHNRAQAQVLAAEDKKLKQVESQAKTEQKPLDSEIKDIKNKMVAYSKIDHYLVDCFALDLKYEYEGMPVYDHGRPTQ